MKYTDILVFYVSHELQKKVAGLFERERETIQSHFLDIDIQNVGSSAIPGAVGKVDVDIQVRVSQEKFEEIVAWMMKYAEVKNPQYWTSQYALFKDKADMIDYNITVIDSRHDTFYRIRDYLIANPSVLEEYNQLKMRYQGRLYEEYRPVRHEFFKRIKLLIPKN